MPCLRQTSAVFTPASCFFNIPMIYSSVNRECFIRPSPQCDGLYQDLEEVQGLRSLAIRFKSTLYRQIYGLRRTIPIVLKRTSHLLSADICRYWCQPLSEGLLSNPLQPFVHGRHLWKCRPQAKLRPALVYYFVARRSAERIFKPSPLRRWVGSLAKTKRIYCEPCSCPHPAIAVAQTPSDNSRSDISPPSMP